MRRPLPFALVSLAALPLALLLGACGPGGGGDGHQPDSGASGKPTEASTNVAPPSASTPATATPAPKTGGNPSRVYQLNTLKEVDVSLKGHLVRLWVMDDEAKQREGMMFLEDKDVKADEGMLFAFDTVQKKTYDDGQPRGFWMSNTFIPLDIVYLSPDGTVLNVAHGKPQDETTVPAGGDFKNVIELKAGTAARFGLKPGDKVTLPKVP